MSTEYPTTVLTIVAAVAAVALVAAVILFGRTTTTTPSRERFDQDDPLTTKGVVHGDPTLCSLWPSGYSFDAEGIVAHPTSSPTDPKCVLVRDGMGLLKRGDASCTPIDDAPELHWFNPLNRIGKKDDDDGLITGLYAENVAGIDRCVVSFSENATAEDLKEIDERLAVAGAQARAQLPLVLKQLETTTVSLNDTTQALADASSQLTSASAQMMADTSAIASCQSDVRQSELQLEALSASSEGAMVSAVSTFKRQYTALQETSQQRLVNRIAADRAALNRAVENEKSACAARSAAAAAAAAASGGGGGGGDGPRAIRSKVRGNYCVDVAGASKNSFAQVFMYDCHGQGNQQWTLDGQRRLISKNSGMCLNVNGAQTNDGAQLIQYPCGNQPNQLWSFNGDGTLRPDHAPNKCLDVYQGKSGNGSSLVLWTCNGGTNQQFYRS